MLNLHVFQIGKTALRYAIDDVEREEQCLPLLHVLLRSVDDASALAAIKDKVGALRCTDTSPLSSNMLTSPHSPHLSILSLLAPPSSECSPLLSAMPNCCFYNVFVFGAMNSRCVVALI